jgi:hypothetical protein
MDVPLMTRPLRKSASGAKTLQQVAMLDMLEHDPRPTFILDGIDAIHRHNGSVLPIYHNPALAGLDGGQFLAMLQGESVAIDTQEHHTLSRFQSWVTTQENSLAPYTYRGYSWVKLLHAKKWNIIFGAPVNVPAHVATVQPNDAPLIKRNSRSKAPTFDWTDALPPLKTTSHIAWARSIGWSQTPLGPMNTWSSQLRSIANLVMQDPRPAVVFYGPDLIMIYNEAEIELLGGFHPCMGMSARVALSSVWPKYFEPIITRNLAGETVEKTDSAIHMVRNGFMEETYFSLKFIPILDSEGATIGHYEPLTETVSHTPFQLPCFSASFFIPRISTFTTPRSVACKHELLL